VGGPRELTGAARTLGHVLFSLGEYKAASLLLEEGVSLARQLQDHHNLAWSLVFLGDLFLQQGEMEQAQGLYQESADLLRELHDKAVLAYAVRRLGQVMRGLEDYERASALCQESLALNLTLGDRRAVAASLVALAGLALAQGNAVHAAHLLGAAERLLNDLAAHLFFPDQLEYDRHRKDVRERLDTSTLNRAWAEGQSMALEQAVAEALGHSPTPGQPRTRVAVEVPGHRLPEMLTERELEILRLLDSGLTTREVAQRLFLSVGTVRWYLNQVYSKLQVHSRTQALSRARELKLLV
jgi:LuxR family maltose regulon positive regulatory protein